MNRPALLLSLALHAAGLAAAVGLAVAGSWPEVRRPARITVRPSEARIAVDPVPDRPRTAEPVVVEPAPPVEADLREPEIVEPEPAEFAPADRGPGTPEPPYDASARLPEVARSNVDLRLATPTPEPPAEPEPAPRTPTVESAPSAHVEARAIDDRNSPPDYPRIALRRGWEGEVVVRLAIDDEGRVRDLTLVQSSGHACLDEAALTAVRAWIYEPAENAHGEPITSELDVPVEFRLEDR